MPEESTAIAPGVLKRALVPVPSVVPGTPATPAIVTIGVPALTVRMAEVLGTTATVLVATARNWSPLITAVTPMMVSVPVAVPL